MARDPAEDASVQTETLFSNNLASSLIIRLWFTSWFLGMSDSDSSNQKMKSQDWGIEEVIQSQDKIMRENLKQIEDDYKQHLRVSIDTAKSMERLAMQEGKAHEAARHRLLAQIYQQILDNYSLSNSYDKP